MMNRFQAATPNGKSITDIWLTPKSIIDQIGISDLDPCGYLPDGANPITVTAKNYFTEVEDGLIQDWSKYKTVFVNFPYSESYKWLEKCYTESLKGVEIIVLCFCRTETRAWQKFVKHATGINLINRRIKFLDKDGIIRGNGNAPSCLIAFSENSYNRIKNVDGIMCRLDN